MCVGCIFFFFVIMDASRASNPSPPSPASPMEFNVSSTPDDDVPIPDLNPSPRANRGGLRGNMRGRGAHLATATPPSPNGGSGVVPFQSGAPSPTGLKTKNSFLSHSDISDVENDLDDDDPDKKPVKRRASFQRNVFGNHSTRKHRMSVDSRRSVVGGNVPGLVKMPSYINDFGRDDSLRLGPSRQASFKADTGGTDSPIILNTGQNIELSGFSPQDDTISEGSSQLPLLPLDALLQRHLNSHPELRKEAVMYLQSMIAERLQFAPWRQRLHALMTKSKVVDHVVLALILLNCVFLSIQDPTSDKNSTINQASRFAEICFTLLFAVEMSFRVMGQGFIMPRVAYLRDPWNCLDCVIVVTGVATVILDLVTDEGVAGVSVLRAFRLFKPLRAVTKVKEIQVIVNSLLQSLPYLIDVAILYFFFLLIMGIVGVQIWKGKLGYTCKPNMVVMSTLDVSEIERFLAKEGGGEVCVQDASWFSEHFRAFICPWGYECVRTGNPGMGMISFDSIWYSFLTLFTVVTMEGWTDIMYLTFHTTSMLSVAYFLIVIPFGSFFIVNLSLVIINNAFVSNVQALQERQLESIVHNQQAQLLQEKKKRKEARTSPRLSALGGSAMDTTRCIDDSDEEELSTSPRPKWRILLDRYRKEVGSVLTHKYFEVTMTMLVLLNGILLGCQFEGQPQEMTDANKVFSVIFTCVYVIECLLKLFAYPPLQFISEPERVLEMLIAITALVDLVNGGDGMFNSLRLIRIFHLARFFPELWLFFEAIANSVKGVAVLTLLLAIVMFIYALLGLNLFGNKYCNTLIGRTDGYADLPTSTCKGQPREHFDTLWSAVIAVFAVISGEDWNLSLYYGMYNTSEIAALYFVSLFVIGNYIVLNLFIAVLLGGLEGSREVVEEEEEPELPDDSTRVKIFDESPANSPLEIPALHMSVATPLHAQDPSSPKISFDEPAGPERNSVHRIQNPRDMAQHRLSNLVRKFSIDTPEVEDSGTDGVPSPLHQMNQLISHTIAKRKSEHGSKENNAAAAAAAKAKSARATQLLKKLSQSAAIISRLNAKNKKNKFQNEVRAVHEMLEKNEKNEKMQSSGSTPAGDEADSSTATSTTASVSASPNAKPALDNITMDETDTQIQDVNSVGATTIQTEGSLTNGPPLTPHNIIDVDEDELDPYHNPEESGQWTESCTSSPPVSLGQKEDDVVGFGGDAKIRSILSPSRTSGSESPTGPKIPTSNRARFEGLEHDPEELSDDDVVEVADSCCTLDAAPSRESSMESSRRKRGGLRGALQNVKEKSRNSMDSVDVQSSESDDEKYWGDPKPAEENEINPPEVTLNPIAIKKRKRRRKTKLTTLFPSLAPAYEALCDAAETICANPDALYILTPENRFRVWMRFVVEWVHFEIGVSIIILVSTVALALEKPLSAPDETLPRVLEMLGVVLAFLFATEALMRCLAYGFILHSDSYLRRDSWNVLDFVIVLASLADFIVSSQYENQPDNVQLLELLRILRTLRPLRFINKSQGLKRVVDALINSVKGLTHVVVITVMIFVILGIVGMQLFLGKFNSCTLHDWGDVSRGQVCPHQALYVTPDFLEQAGFEPNACLPPYIATREECLQLGYRWQSFRTNFNNLGRALVSLFEIATLEGWIEVMRVGVDSTSQDHAPVLNNNPIIAIYFIAVIVIVAFFLVNLFVGVLLAEYEQAGENDEFANELTDPQQEWRLLLDLVVSNTKPLPRNIITIGKNRAALTQFVSSRTFETGISICIALNVVVMSLETADQSSTTDDIQSYIGLVFVMVFLLEAILKLAVLGVRQYFADTWNRFDFAVVVISVSGSVLMLTVKFTPFFISVVRVLRLARLLRVARMTKGVRMLLRTLFLSVASLVNVGALLALLFSLYAILGVRFFGKIARGNFVSRHANFESFINAVLVLFRILTGEGWHGIMSECRIRPPLCDQHLRACGDPVFAYIYFLSFIVLSTFILLNLIVAIILKEFSTATEEDAGLLTSDDLTNFHYEWERFDPGRTGFIDTKNLVSLIEAIDLPLGSSKAANVSPFIKAMQISEHLTLYRNCVYQKEVLLSLVQGLVATEFGVEMSQVELPSHLQSLVNEKLGSVFPVMQVCFSLFVCTKAQQRFGFYLFNFVIVL